MEQCRNQVYEKVWRVLIDDEWIFDDTEKGSLQVDVRRGVGVCEGWGFIRNFPLIIKTSRLATTRDVPTKDSFSSARSKIHYSRRAMGRVRRTPRKKRWKYDYDHFARWINWWGMFFHWAFLELWWLFDIPWIDRDWHGTPIKNVIILSEYFEISLHGNECSG